MLYSGAGSGDVWTRMCEKISPAADYYRYFLFFSPNQRLSAR